MEDRSNAVATAARRPVPASPSLIKTERRIVRSVPRRDLQVGSMPRTNVLVVGNPDATRIVVDMLRLDLRGPIARCRAGQPLDLPSPAHAATLVLENVSRLTTDEQFRVLRWLDDVSGRIRVVSTTNEPLWPRVQVGVFNEVLYYRLNTVFVDMGTV
jgi:sigma-54-interacting transcriptional regulator